MAARASGYSVLTHEAVIDSTWDDSLKPLILAHFLHLTPEQLREAHAYAYGGAIIQDMGYYPFGSKLFSDLVHYVRSGDFVTALLRDASDENEYAFALGALAHYAGDNDGHPIAVNRSVPMLYPKLRRKFGDVVTYEDDPGAHIKTEFGFDVIEVAHGRYAPQAYHEFIGFKVSKPLLERSFQDTYGIELKDVFKSLDLALGTYRRTVSHLIPEMTKVAWTEKKDEIGKSLRGVTRRKFVYNLSRASYEKEWGGEYERPGAGARILAFFLRIIPKVGPFRALGFRVPTPQAEKLLMESFNRTLASYRARIADVKANRLQFADTNLDVGRKLDEGGYHLADKAYSQLLEKLADRKAAVPPELQQQIVAYFKNSNVTLSDKAGNELQLLRQSASTSGFGHN